MASDPKTTTADLYSALNTYAAFSPENSPKPVIVPPDDRPAYRAAVQNIQNLQNQNTPQIEFWSTVQALSIAQALPAGPDRTAAIQAAETLMAAQTQRDADYVLAQEAATAAQLKQDGRPGAALLILYNPNPESLIQKSQTDAAASQIKLDAAYAQYQAVTGVSRNDLLTKAASDVLSTNLTPEVFTGKSAAELQALLSGSTSTTDSTVTLPSALTASDPGATPPLVFTSQTVTLSGQSMDLSQLETISSATEPAVQDGVGDIIVAPPSTDGMTADPASLCGR
jgi:hypothetical protein